MDLVVTIFDSTIAQICPMRPVSSINVRWSIPDLAAVEGLPFEQELTFESAWLVD